MNWFTRWFFKLTGWLPGLLLIRPKIYQSNRNKHTNRIKGKAIIIANHKRIEDFFTIYLVFFWKRVRTLVSELFYHHRFLAWLSRVFAGNILVHRERSDLSWMAECEKRLNKGDNICIFPEGRLVHEKGLGEFHPSCVYLALRTNTPIVPVYIAHEGFWHRKRVNIGEPIYLSDYCDHTIPTMEEAKALCKMLQGKVNELAHQMDLYRKYHAYNKLDFKWFTFDFFRISCKMFKFIVFPAKFHYEKGANRKDRKIKGRAIICSKHNGVTDAPILTTDYWNRRLHIIVASEASEKVGIVKHLGTINYNRQKGESDPKMMIDVMNFLKCNSLVGIYPEGHIIKDGVGEFANGAAYFAIKSNSPIYINIPMNPYKAFHRNHIMIGKKIDPQEIFTEEELKDKATIQKLTDIIYNKFVELYEAGKQYQK